MRIPFFAIVVLSCIGSACGVTEVDDLFDPTPSGGAAGKGGTGGQTGGSGGGGSGGTGGSSATGGTGGSTGGTGGSTGGTGGGGGTGGTVGGAGGTGGGGAAGTGGTGGTVADSGADVRRDAADMRDAGKGGIRCGSSTCDPATQYCCFGSSSTRCVSAGSALCSTSSDRLHCDDTADCAAGQVCCGSEGSSGAGADAVCILATLGCAAPRQMLCDPTVTAPCLNIANIVCSANNSGIFEDYPYCHVP